MSTCLSLVLRLPRCAALHDASVGLAVVMWSYPRGGKLDKAGETVLDVCAYAAHMAALLGAQHHQGPPTNVLWQPEAKAAAFALMDSPAHRPRFARDAVASRHGAIEHAIELGGPTIDRFETAARGCEMPLF